MESVLRGLFRGEILPWERGNPQGEKYLEIVRRIEDEERYFAQKMSLDDCGRLQALAQLYAELGAEEEESVFSYGFTLGLLLALDVTREAQVLR